MNQCNFYNPLLQNSFRFCARDVAMGTELRLFLTVTG